MPLFPAAPQHDWIASHLEYSKLIPEQFDYWHPHIIKLGIPTPRSISFPLSPAVIKAIYREMPVSEIAEIPEAADLEEAIKQTFLDLGADTLFLKNSLFSAKHWWRQTCCLPKNPEPNREHHILEHVATNLYLWLMNSIDLPSSIVIREMLDVSPAFYAFKGMPIVPEFRLFTEGGRVVGYQPYWPEDSILEPDSAEWREKLEAISRPTQEQLLVMTRHAEKISLPGDWSVDFLIDNQGSPWLIDMALAGNSFRSSLDQGYVNCPIVPPISSDADYQSALQTVTGLLDSALSAHEHLAFERLVAAIEDFEADNFYIDSPSKEARGIFLAQEQLPRSKKQN